jgi:hypothetical protein
MKNCPRLLVLLCVAVVFGCDARQPKKFSRSEDLERYAALPFASATHDEKLRAELARVVAEGGTPAQLAGLTTETKPATSRPQNPIVAELHQIFPAEIRDKFAQRLRSVYPDARFQFAPLVRGTARELLLAAEERRIRFQRLMATSSMPPAFHRVEFPRQWSRLTLCFERVNGWLGKSILYPVSMVCKDVAKPS